MRFKPATWFREVWPRATARAGVVSGYAALSGEIYLLTDIALRGRVWSNLEVRDRLGSVDVPATMMQLGRRELALEILELAGMSADRLWQYVERPDAPEGAKR